MNNNDSVFVWIQLVWIRIFLSIEDTVNELEGENPESEQIINQQYQTLKDSYASLKASIRKKVGDAAGGLGKAIGNVRNIARNAIDNTVGYGIAKYQNAKTTRTLRRNPQTGDQIVYLMHGLFQNEGSQWRLAKQMRKQGKIPYHLKGHHNLERAENAEKTFEQIGNLHEKTDLYKPHERYDAFSGHSSGGDMGIYLATDPRTPQYGIKKVQARAPAPTGIEAKTFGQKLLMPLAKADNVETYEGKQYAVEMSKRKPIIPVLVGAGEEDRLVLPEQTAYKHAADHTYYRGPNSTHFGTSGGNKPINEQIIAHLDKPRSEYRPLTADRPSNVVSMSEYKSRRNEEPPEYRSEREEEAA